MAGSIAQSPGVKKAGHSGNVKLVSVRRRPKLVQLGPAYVAKPKKKGATMLRGSLKRA